MALKISVCVTYFNEKEEDIKKLIDSLKKQTLKPDEIILINAADYNNCSRSVGRNLAIKKARNEIIAMTDVGCVADRHWLKNITKPFVNNAQVVAGNYRMVAKTSLQKAMSKFLGIDRKKFNNNFLPATRSIAFKKSIWKIVGGFDENIKGAAEDTLFNYQLIKKGIKIFRAKNAIVEWGMPESIFEFARKIFNYAKGDARTKILFFPNKGLSSHNIKVLFVFLRYCFAFSFLIFSIISHWTLGYWFLLALISIYFIYSYKKAGMWGILLQINTDISTMIGFSLGIIGK